MREVKFRVKIKGDAGIYNVWGIDWLTGKIMVERACGNELVLFEKIEKLMQFTGLLDKNGKEIYESDILKTGTDKNMVVTWSDKFASFCLNRDGWAFQHWFGEACSPEDCEVIGDIFSNPELIK